MLASSPLRIISLGIPSRLARPKSLGKSNPCDRGNDRDCGADNLAAANAFHGHGNHSVYRLATHDHAGQAGQDPGSVSSAKNHINDGLGVTNIDNTYGGVDLHVGNLGAGFPHVATLACHIMSFNMLSSVLNADISGGINSPQRPQPQWRQSHCPLPRQCQWPWHSLCSDRLYCRQCRPSTSSSNTADDIQISFFWDTGGQVEKEEVAVLEFVHQSFMLE
ncbi:MAG: hypothetical protein ALECFALPRED_001490 [Alectoria fallacina]|uniref:Uncharacterized protein n=1 Tax=Alectoria fallacina TaxID=1903189 RepID=A0A8H3F6L7_9LECA|nr:MAG: hypothetical protein ALECFALPRED_001490 [Alectoria fallacina]